MKNVIRDFMGRTGEKVGSGKSNHPKALPFCLKICRTQSLKLTSEKKDPNAEECLIS